jgi:glutathione S-transferase
MKLFYMPGACSLASHIVLREAGETFEIESVDGKTKTTASGGDFRALSPNGYVPALQLDDDRTLTEGAAILQYIADQHPEAGLAPANGTLERARVQEFLNFTSSELHKAFSPLFSSTLSDAEKKTAQAGVARRLDHIENVLSDGRDYLVGDKFSVADAYLFVVANWANPTGIGLGQWPNVGAFVGRVAARPSSQAALRAEGLI